MRLRATDRNPYAAGARRPDRVLAALRLLERHVAQRPKSEDLTTDVHKQAAAVLRPFRRADRGTPSSI